MKDATIMNDWKSACKDCVYGGDCSIWEVAHVLFLEDYQKDEIDNLNLRIEIAKGFVAPPEARTRTDAWCNMYFDDTWVER